MAYYFYFFVILSDIYFKYDAFAMSYKIIFLYTHFLVLFVTCNKLI